MNKTDFLGSEFFKTFIVIEEFKNSYYKTAIFNLDLIFEKLEPILSKRVVFKEQVWKVLAAINRKILNKALRDGSDIYVCGAVVLNNNRLAEDTGLTLRQVKRVKEFLSEQNFIEFYKTIKTAEYYGFTHLWNLNLNDYGLMVDVDFNNIILGESIVDNDERQWIDRRSYSLK